MPKSHAAAGTSMLKIYAAGAVVCAAVSVGTYFLGVRPAIAGHADFVRRQHELKVARTKAAGLTGVRNNTQNQLNAVTEALKSQTLHLEPASTVNLRLTTLTELATRECKLAIDEMRPGPGVEASDYQVVPILIAGSGTYPNCAKFLHRLRERFPDTAVRSFETTNNSTSPDAPSATFQFELAWHAAKN